MQPNDSILTAEDQAKMRQEAQAGMRREAIIEQAIMVGRDLGGNAAKGLSTAVTNRVTGAGYGSGDIRFESMAERDLFRETMLAEFRTQAARV